MQIWHMVCICCKALLQNIPEKPSAFPAFPALGLQKQAAEIFHIASLGHLIKEI